MALVDSDIADLVAGTLKHLGKLKFNQIATTLQNYEVMSRIMKKDRVQFDSGNGIQRTIMTDESGAARDTGLYETDTVNVSDVLALLDIPWRHTTTNYAFERREMLMNRGTSRIVDLMKVRRAGAMISLAKVMEDRFWSKPADSNDSLKVFGVKYWLVANATTGFNGGDPSGFASGAGNLATATYPRWKNYTAAYTNVTKGDLIKKWRTAYRKCRFISPVTISDYRKGNGQNFRFYTNEARLSDLEDLGEAQNENLGRDLATMDGSITFKRHPIIWVPALDDSTAPTNPIYGINWSWFHPVFLRGDYLRETEPAKAANQHNVFVIHVDLTWNILCTNRREQMVLCTAV